jgi:hypothetical protein
LQRRHAVTTLSHVVEPVVAPPPEPTPETHPHFVWRWNPDDQQWHHYSREW